MTEATETKAHYNTVAIDIADKLHAVRRTVHAEQKTKPHSMDALFPAVNPHPCRRSTRIRNDGQSTRIRGTSGQATQHKVQFEHPCNHPRHGDSWDRFKATTDARNHYADRQTLLERKVIFFREQGLSEDQQVAFGRYFGDLDAFPFGRPARTLTFLRSA